MLLFCINLTGFLVPVATVLQMKIIYIYIYIFLIIGYIPLHNKGFTNIYNNISLSLNTQIDQKYKKQKLEGS